MAYNIDNVHTISALVYKGDLEGLEFDLCVRNFSEYDLKNALLVLSRAIFHWKTLSKEDFQLYEKMVQLSLRLVFDNLCSNKSKAHVIFLCDCEARFRVAELAMEKIKEFKGW